MTAVAVEVVLCGCGCGLPAPISTKTSARDGQVKGRPMRFRQGHNMRPHLAAVCDPQAYAEQLLGRAELIVAAVRDEGPAAVRTAIDEALVVPNPPNIDPYEALVTVLAAQVDVDAPRSVRVGWADLGAGGVS